MTIKSESEAREYIQKIYMSVRMPLPDGWDDPEVLGSLRTAMTRLDHDLAKPEVRRMISNSSQEKLN